MMLADLWWKLIRFGFHLLYHEMAFTYDWVSWLVSLGQWRCWQRSVLQFLPDPDSGQILELAHGTGNLQVDLQMSTYPTVALDLSPHMGRIARRKLLKHQLNDVFVQGSAFRLPFMDKAFVGLVCTFPTDFIVQAGVLQEIHRVLQRDRKAIIVLNGIFSGRGLVERFLEWLYHITGQRDDRQNSILSYFEGYGFDVQAIEVECKSSMAQLIILTKSV